jgi:leader peptidase (prepilin peptidase)/N-methyltransferase
MSLGTLAEIYAWFPIWLLRAGVILFGLLWGSFLNVVIYRVPREMSVVHPPSHCPGCGKPIAPYDNIPVFTYLLLRGRARCCGARMSPRYPMVELLGGALSLAILEAVIFRMPGSASAARALAVYGADFALCLGLVAAAFIDAEHMFLPDSVTLGGVVLGIATATLRDLPLSRALFGAGAGFVGVWLPFIFLYKGLLGRTGMGMGDAKLLALAGAWFGWEGAVFVLFAGALQGTVYAAGLKIFGIKPSLPQAVLEDIAELEKAAAEGDEEAKKALDEDPLTENEDDAFILRWLGLGAKKAPDPKPEGEAPEAPKTEGEAPEAPEAPTADAPLPEDDEADEPPRARIPFGPFLILACLELLFAGDWFAARLGPLFGPM